MIFTQKCIKTVLVPIDKNGSQWEENILQNIFCVNQKKEMASKTDCLVYMSTHFVTLLDITGLRRFM